MSQKWLAGSVRSVQRPSVGSAFYLLRRRLCGNLHRRRGSCTDDFADIEINPVATVRFRALCSVDGELRPVALPTALPQHFSLELQDYDLRIRP